MAKTITIQIKEDSDYQNLLNGLAHREGFKAEGMRARGRYQARAEAHPTYNAETGVWNPTIEEFVRIVTIQLLWEQAAEGLKQKAQIDAVAATSQALEDRKAIIDASADEVVISSTDS